MNATHSILRVALMTALAMLLPSPVLTQQLKQAQSQSAWGAASKGICAGVDIMRVGWSPRKDDLYVTMEVGSMSTNRLFVWLPPLEDRYEIELRGPDGRRIRQLKSPSFSQKVAWLGLEPLSKNGSLDWFFLKDTFAVETNGPYTLIASVRVNVFSNFSIGRYTMQENPTYFLLPPVTNTFNIRPEPTMK